MFIFTFVLSIGCNIHFQEFGNEMCHLSCSGIIFPASSIRFDMIVITLCLVFVLKSKHDVYPSCLLDHAFISECYQNM